MESKIREIVISSINEINTMFTNSIAIEKGLQCPLYGKNGPLDSIGLVNLVVLIEERINDQLKLNILLADEKAFSQENSPFSTGEALVNYINNLVVRVLCDE